MQTIDQMRKAILEDPTASTWLKQQALMLSPERVPSMLCDAAILLDLLQTYVEQSFVDYAGDGEASHDTAWTLEPCWRDTAPGLSQG